MWCKRSIDYGTVRNPSNQKNLQRNQRTGFNTISIQSRPSLRMRILGEEIDVIHVAPQFEVILHLWRNSEFPPYASLVGPFIHRKNYYQYWMTGESDVSVLWNLSISIARLSQLWPSACERVIQRERWWRKALKRESISRCTITHGQWYCKSLIAAWLECHDEEHSLTVSTTYQNTS